MEDTPHLRLVASAPPPKDDPRDTCWVCTHCGCQTFWLLSSDEVQCAACRTFSEGPDDVNWRRRVPDPPAEIPEVEPHSTHLAVMDTSAHAIRRHINRIKDSDPIFLFGFNRDGYAYWWGEGRADARPDIEERLTDALDAINRFPEHDCSPS